MTFGHMVAVVTAATMVISTSPAVLKAQQPSRVVARSPGDTLQNRYRLYDGASAAMTTAPARPRGLLVLLPAYGGDVDSFSAQGFSPSTLPTRMAAHGIVTIVAVPVAETLYADDVGLTRLDAMVSEVRRQYRIAADRVMIGGFSAGGTGAVRYAQRCAQSRCRDSTRVAAVFAVDAPLDFARVWRSERLSLQRAAPETNLVEARAVVAELRRTLGGSPDAVPAVYRARSPLLASASDGGQARVLRRTAIRLYTEPDVQWWIANRRLDYHAMNAVDHAALVTVLQIAGNTRAELITTVDRGVRPNGTRHPHSWSIVDEAALEAWLLRMLEPAT